jgi:arylsulfatase
VIDIVPTLLDLAGGERSQSLNGESAPPLPGRSLAPVFGAEKTAPRDSLWWLHEGNRAIRIGDWKLVALGANGAWELYDLGQDRAETQDLIEKYPEKAKELEAAWNARWKEFQALALKDAAAKAPPTKKSRARSGSAPAP